MGARNSSIRNAAVGNIGARNFGIGSAGARNSFLRT